MLVAAKPSTLHMCKSILRRIGRMVPRQKVQSPDHFLDFKYTYLGAVQCDVASAAKSGPDIWFLCQTLIVLDSGSRFSISFGLVMEVG